MSRCHGRNRQELDAITEDVRALVWRYQERLAQMDAALQAELAPLQERVDRLRNAVEGAMRRFHPALPARPEAETDLVDEVTWLFDGRRDYLTQLSSYQARKNGQAVDELTA
jgi:hypothetical protein